jgi:hypothetical protein
MIEIPAVTNSTPTLIRTLHSATINQEYRLFISLPALYAESEKSYPVLYLLDGNGVFGFVRSIVELQQVIQTVPELIIVGIGYPTATYMDTLSLRGRDFTVNKLTPEEKAGGYPFEETGGAARFFTVLRDEIIPSIDREFRTLERDRALAGWSLGAAFSLYTLFQTPLLFNRIISISPYVNRLERLELPAVQDPAFLPVKLYVGIERSADTPELNTQIARTEQFLKRLSENGDNKFITRFHVLEGIDHAQSGPIGYTHALKEIYNM